VLSHEEYYEAMDSIVAGGIQLAAAGKQLEALKTLGSLIKAAWVLTREGATMHVVDCTDRVPEELRSTILSFEVVCVVDEANDPLVGFGRARNHEGGSVAEGHQLTTAQHSIMMRLTDDCMKEHFGHLDMSGVAKMSDAFVEEVRQDLDKQVEEFRSELDSLFETWGGGES
jgi:hypothetical protein